MKNVLNLIALTLFILGCQSCLNNDQKAEDLIKKDVSSNTATIDKIYTAKGNEEKEFLAFIKEGNVLYEAKFSGKKGALAFIIEEEKYAYSANDDGTKGPIAFIKEKNKIYAAKEKDTKEGIAFIVE